MSRFVRLLLSVTCLGACSCGGSPRLVVLAPEGPIANALIQNKPCPPSNQDCLDVISVPYEDLFARAESDLVEQSERNTESADLYLLDDAWVAEFRGRLTHFDSPTPRPPFQETLRPRWTDGAQYWAIPLLANFQMLFRKGLDTKQGETWSEIVKTTARSNGSYPSFVLRGRSNYALTNDFLPILWAYGGELTVKEQSASLTPEPNALAAIHALRELARSGPPYEQRLSTDGLRIELKNRMGVMAIEWSAAASQLSVPEATWSRIPCSGEPARRSTKAPSGACNGAGVLSVWMLAAPARPSDEKSEKFDATVKLFQWLTSLEASQSLCKLDAVVTGPPVPTNCIKTQSVDYYDNYSPFTSPVMLWQDLGLKQVLPGKLRPETRYWHTIDERIGGALSNVLLGLQGDEKKALKELNHGLTDLVNPSK
jgi:multiple sugar transport system substrate-binding protein